MKKYIPLLLVSMTVPLFAADVAKELTLADLRLPPDAIPPGMQIGYIAVAGGEAYQDTQNGTPHFLIRLPAAAAVRGVVVAYPIPDPDEVVNKNNPTAVIPLPTPKLIPFSISENIFAAAADGSEAIRKYEQVNFSYRVRTGNDEFGSSTVLSQSVDRGTRAWWSLRLAQIQDTEPAPAVEARRQRRDELDATIDLFTGITALNENLQFDRRFAVSGGSKATIAIDTLPTLQVRELPWDRMAGATDAKPAQLDLLAQHLPADQYALFFPSFPALVTAIQHADATLSGPLQLLAGHGADAGTKQRYQRQLGLELNELSKRFGEQVIDHLALTGSDPFLRTGSDVAVILHAKQPALLAAYLLVKQQALIQAGAVATQGKIGTYTWKAAVSADRSLSNYVLSDGAVTVVTNSLAQITAYIEVRTGAKPALASLPEMTFFRRRYVPEANELAFLVISDATIRRWTSAQWRIGDSRRTRALAVMMNMQAEWIAAGCAATWRPTNIPEDLGEITVTTAGIHSSIYGSLGFMTPIAELNLTLVTTDESEAYKRFHDRYQRSWRDYFDPIAARLYNTTGNRFGVDLSVLPLIVGTEYRDVLRFAGKAKIAPDSGDPHNSLLQIAVALDHETGPLADFNNEASAMLGGLTSPFGWVGNTASIYADPDPVFWDEFLNPMNNRYDRFSQLEKDANRFPIGIHIAVRNQLKLAAFLTALQAMAKTSAPNLLTWTTNEWKGMTYVVVAPTQEAGNGFNLRLFYLPAAEGLTLTVNETVMKNAIDRLIAKRAATTAGKPVPDQRPWLGEQMAAFIQPNFLVQLNELDNRGRLSDWMDNRVNNDIAILNEWHRLFPKEDPVTVHQRLWNTTLTCPFGGTYRWNEATLSMESSVFGAANEDYKGPVTPAALAAIASINAGIAFEELPNLITAQPDPNDRNNRRPGEPTTIGLRVRLEIEPATLGINPVIPIIPIP